MKKQEKPKPAIFLDRDGVIIQDTGYPYKLEELKLLDGAALAIARMRRAGYLVIVATNQSGIARGIFTIDQLYHFHVHLQSELLKSHTEAILDRIFYCPHHPQGKVKAYTLTCQCRKPGIGMVSQACEQFLIDIGNSYFVGDKGSDMECGKKANLKATIQIQPPGTKKSKYADYSYISLSDWQPPVADSHNL